MDAYSVLMSVYRKDDPKYLTEAIDSMLHQSIEPAELVVVCDGPLSDELNAVIDRYSNSDPTRFKVIRLEKNQGLGEALRQGMQHCTFELVARMDSDDISLPERMAMQLAYLDAHKDVSVLGGQIREFQNNVQEMKKVRAVPTEPEEIKKFCAKRNPMNHMSVTLRKSDVLAAGGYVGFDKFEDYYLWARMLAAGYQLANLNELCVYVRAGDELYLRRGGMPYFRRTVAIEKKLQELGICSRLQMVSNLTTRFVATVLLTNRMRKFFYNRFLRK